MVDLVQLRRQRGTIKCKLTIFDTFLKTIKDNLTNKVPIEDYMIKDLQFRVSNIEPLLDQFDSIQLEIEYASPDEQLEGEYAQRSEFTDNYCKRLAEANSIFSTLACKDGSVPVPPVQSVSSESSEEHSHEVSANSVNHSINLKGARLPTINLSKFNGNYNKWLEFKDTFESLINVNKAITEIQRFHYLQASLEGDASKMIQSLELTAHNYKTAWQLLCNRYNNSKLLVHNHIKAIFECECLLRESASGLRNLVDTVYKNLRALETLNQPVNNWDALIIFIISTKLDKTTAREWEKQKGESATLDDMSKFQFQFSFSSVSKCSFCKQPHTIYTCKDFLELDVPERVKRVTDLKLCPNCLCTGHPVKACHSGPCKKCKVKHNSLLHQEPTAEPQVSLSIVNHQRYVLLSTAIILIYDAFGTPRKAKAILDGGSQSNFISTRLCKRLQLSQEPTNVAISGISSISSINHKCNVVVRSINNTFSIQFSCLLLPRFTDHLPVHHIDVSSWNIPKHLNLADRFFNVPAEIELLIGGGEFWNLIRNGKISLGDHAVF